jgi:hypothetical protein
VINYGNIVDAVQAGGPGTTAIARRTIATSHPHSPGLVLEEEKTVEREFGWVFFYTTRKFLETRDKKHLMPGNAPLVVLKEDGSTHYLGTSLAPPKNYALVAARSAIEQRVDLTGCFDLSDAGAYQLVAHYCDGNETPPAPPGGSVPLVGEVVSDPARIEILANR